FRHGNTFAARSRRVAYDVFADVEPTTKTDRHGCARVCGRTRRQRHVSPERGALAIAGRYGHVFALRCGGRRRRPRNSRQYQYPWFAADEAMDRAAHLRL